MREFTTAVKQESGGETAGPDIVIKIDDREVTFMAPDEAAMAMMLSADVAPIGQKISAAINFFFGSIKDARDVDYFKGRLWDRSDPFGTAAITEIIEALTEEWTGNPTQQSSDSTSSQESTGD